jgi:hypothetical protein
LEQIERSNSRRGRELLCLKIELSANGAEYESQGQARSAPLESNQISTFGRAYLPRYFGLSGLGTVCSWYQGRRAARLPLAFIFRAVGASTTPPALPHPRLYHTPWRFYHTPLAASTTPLGGFYHTPGSTSPVGASITPVGASTSSLGASTTPLGVRFRLLRQSFEELVKLYDGRTSQADQSLIPAIADTIRRIDGRINVSAQTR